MNAGNSKDCNLADVTLVVLAGGVGRRMGLPKAYLQLRGKPILAWLLDSLRWPGPTMLVTAPAVPTAPGADQFDRHLIDPADGLGPLRGVLTALEGLTTSLAVFITVDMPSINQEMLVWLIEMLNSRPQDYGSMCRVTCGDHSRVEPFPSVFRRQAAPLVAQRMEQGRRSVQDLCCDPPFAAIEVPPAWPTSLWTNLNDPAEYAAFESEHNNF